MERTLTATRQTKNAGALTDEQGSEWFVGLHAIVVLPSLRNTNAWPSARRAVTFQMDEGESFAPVELIPFTEDTAW